MLIGRYIYGKLSNDTGVSALVEDRIYPVLLPMDEPYPSIVYTVTNEPLDNNAKQEKASYDRQIVTFHVWADQSQGQQAYDDIDDIDAAIREALDRVEDTVSGVTVEAAYYLGSQDGRDESRGLFLREIRYSITTRN